MYAKHLGKHQCRRKYDLFHWLLMQISLLVSFPCDICCLVLRDETVFKIVQSELKLRKKKQVVSYSSTIFHLLEE